MQRWFFLEDPKRPKYNKRQKKMAEKPPEPEGKILTQIWTFTVNAPDVGPKEKMFVTGSIPELGEWDNNKVLLLDREEGTDLWCKSITIPNTCDILYRYGKCIVNEANSNAIIIRQWETHQQPRIIKETDLHPFTDTYGYQDDKHMVYSGWLTVSTLLQFKFMNNPLKLQSCLAKRLLRIKITPVKLSFGADAQVDDSSLSTDASAGPECGVLVDVSTLHDDPAICVMKPQEQFGRDYKEDDVLLINVTAPNINALAYLVDFYAYSSRAASEDPPCHVGYTYVLPNMFKSSEGALDLPVTCNVKHRPLGTVNIGYLIVNPMPEQLCDLSMSLGKFWDPSWTGLEVGHRGLGASFKTKDGDAIRENTIASLKKAAASGADLLEFDVQLSKDMVPVIYHDFYVCISMKRKREVEHTEMLEVPVKDLTLEHLQKLKVYHLLEGRNQETLFFDDELEEHQPFPTLEETLKKIDPHVGFNVELKWTMELKDGTFELNNPFDMNTYVDKVLETVLKHAGDRRIIFSCFNPDICTMVRQKQNKYPVMFLTIGITKRYQPYRDARCSSIPLAVQSAVSTEILGVVVHTEDLLRDPTQVKLATDAGLIIFCWGDDIVNKSVVKKLKDMGLHAVIYDKLDQYTTKDVKESIFLMEARESQRELMQQAALDDEASTKPSSSSEQENIVVNLEDRPFFNPSVRETIDDRSTVTSLESVVCDDARTEHDKDIIEPIAKEDQVKDRDSIRPYPYPYPCDPSKLLPKKKKRRN
ncbi:glycerophosphocholine phosphodiesterase GPCPD1 isoform X1 [Spodoptera frugiperda]|uniref:Glycerophosphocholine phosphodiesterase GPCPD1 isoform X1 n=2 Tax=Spodoptera frugiperda TaxID=7108 RepID=A0A9R0DAF9_SPOFR|nr:glycerophosphocholine phosphodiesterase GPCPD1 isoform X1 [Spodoptera frugiperda]